MRYRVGTLRDAGLEAKWGKSDGCPALFARYPEGVKHQRETWWLVHNSMWEAMKVHGIVSGFEEATCLADIFSIPVRA